jgi:type III secretion system low calcium response chaperone LcrH/SycD
MNPESEKKKEELKEPPKEGAVIDTTGMAEKIASLLSAGGAPARDTVTALLTQALNKGIMPKQALQLGDDTMEAIYSQAYTLYNQGRYKEASYIFRLLMLLDYSTPKYPMGLAACLHRQKDYRSAANIYLLCGTLDPKNPLPHYHAADCYMQLNYPMMALFSLGLAIKAADTQPQYAIIKERATLMREALKKQIKQEMEEDAKKSPEKKKAEKKK